MSTLAEIEQAIRRLPADEFRYLREKIAELDQERWDKQLELDVAAGRLEALAEEALREHEAGLTRKL